MKIAIMQPYVFPYVGYFQLIQAVDTFVFYDDVNFIKKGWIHRNNILINNTSYLFTIPCKEISQNKLIKNIKLNFDIDERIKFLKRINLSYRKASNFCEFYPLLEEFIINDKSEYISQLACNSIKFICDYLGLKKKFEFSSICYSNSIGMEKQERLINIAQSLNANTYINASGGISLYDKKCFFNEDLDLKFLFSSDIKYQQYNSSFVPWLSIIDVVMFNSVKKTNELLNQYILE